MTSLDWAALMRAGMTPLHAGGLALRPPEFWALTPAELALMLGRAARPAMGRARFEALAALYPDAPRGAQPTENPDGSGRL